MTIDSHQHFWNYEPEKHSWIDDEMSVIRRDFLSDDLQKVFDENGVDACVAVQADQTTEETDFLISLADRWKVFFTFSRESCFRTRAASCRKRCLNQ